MGVRARLKVRDSYLRRDVERGHIEKSLAGGFKGGHPLVTLTFAPKTGEVLGVLAWRQKPEDAFVDVALGASMWAAWLIWVEAFRELPLTFFGFSLPLLFPPGPPLSSLSLS